MSFIASALISAIGVLGSTHAQTDFGIRSVPGATANLVEDVGSVKKRSPEKIVPFDQASVVHLGLRWGRVTSTRRTAERNRAVGGAPNSHHLRGRAIDIARGPGVRHSQIEAAYRRAGYYLIESLDEGDHSHFAFGTAAARVNSKASQIGRVDPFKGWRIVSAPRY